MIGGINMKTSRTLLLALAALVLLAATVSASGVPKLIVTNYHTEGVAEVGKEFTLVVDLANIGGVCAMTTAVHVQASPPFIAESGTIGPLDLCDKATVRIPLRVDPTTNGGPAQLSLSMDYYDLLTTAYSASDSLTIFVVGAPSLSAHIVGSEPLDVYPGDTGTLSVAIQNDGTYEAQAVSGTLTADAPLEVSWSASTLTIGALGPRQTFAAKLAVKVPKDAEAKDYPMRLTLNYLDEDRNDATAVIPLTFHVKKKALFEATDSNDMIYANDQLKVVHVTLTNTGMDTARRMKIKIAPQYPFTSDGSVRYVETLAPGQSMPVDFVVNVDKDGTPGSYGLDMILDFEDPQGNILHDTAKLALSLQEKNLFRAYIFDYWYMWVAAAIVITLLVRRRLKRRRKA